MNLTESSGDGLISIDIAPNGRKQRPETMFLLPAPLTVTKIHPFGTMNAWGSSSIYRQ